MTKRFSCTDNGFIVDYQSEQKVLNLYDVVDLLNELSDKNEQLKQLCSSQQLHINKLQHEKNGLIEHLGRLEEENGRLKHWNKCLAEKRHNELKGDGV